MYGRLALAKRKNKFNNPALVKKFIVNISKPEVTLSFTSEMKENEAEILKNMSMPKEIIVIGEPALSGSIKAEMVIKNADIIILDDLSEKEPFIIDDPYPKLKEVAPLVSYKEDKNYITGKKLPNKKNKKRRK